MGAPRCLSYSSQLELFGPPSKLRGVPRVVPTAPALRAARYREGDPSSIRVGNEWLDDLLVAHKMEWVIQLETWLRRRVAMHSTDRTLNFPQKLLQCQVTGTRPVSPVAKLAAVFVGSMLGISSLRELERAAAIDLRFILAAGRVHARSQHLREVHSPDAGLRVGGVVRAPDRGGDARGRPIHSRHQRGRHDHSGGRVALQTAWSGGCRQAAPGGAGRCEVRA